jgi:hypothetical protein
VEDDTLINYELSINESIGRAIDFYFGKRIKKSFKPIVGKPQIKNNE